MFNADDLIKIIDDRITACAVEMFKEELRFGFRNLDRSDDPWNQELSGVLKKQSDKQLEILARVLPLGVFWENSNIAKKRLQLEKQEKEAVGQFREDYDRLCKERFSEQVERVSKSKSRRTFERFKFLTEQGKTKVNEISALWGWEAVSAGLGEWGGGASPS